jgi:nucleoside-diphosphate-sugar epimerase
MRVAITGDDGFIAHYIKEALGDDAEIFTDEIINDEMMLPAKLASCEALIHLNGHPPDLSLERDDHDVLQLMRKNAKGILDCVKGHQGLHLILIGSLRVHSSPQTAESYYSSESPLSPRDVTSEGQLWVEERALEHATDTHPVSILRVANVQGIPPDGQEGHGIVHRFCREACFGFFNVPGNGEEVKDMIHVTDLANVVAAVLEKPPPTRQAIAVGCAQGVNMGQLANLISERTGSSPEFTGDKGTEVWGIVDGWELEQRVGFRPELSIGDIVEEALAHAN